MATRRRRLAEWCYPGLKRATQWFTQLLRALQGDSRGVALGFGRFGSEPFLRSAWTLRLCENHQAQLVLLCGFAQSLCLDDWHLASCSLTKPMRRITETAVQIRSGNLAPFVLMARMNWGTSWREQPGRHGIFLEKRNVKRTV